MGLAMWWIGRYAPRSVFDAAARAARVQFEA
jgi:hypothetical protein